MNLKKFKVLGGTILLSATIATTLSSNVVLAKEDSVKNQEIVVTYNDQKIEFDQKPIIKNGNTLVPFRAIFESMGTMVYYNPQDKSILGISRDGDIITHTIGTNTAIVNGKEKAFGASSEMINDRTLIPVRMVSELLNAEVDWNGKEQKVTIEKYEENNEFNKLIKEILKRSANQNFNPENFNRYCKYVSSHPELSIEDSIINVNMDLDLELVEVGPESFSMNPYFNEGSEEVRNSISNVLFDLIESNTKHFEPKKEDIKVVKNINDPLVLVNKFHRLPKDHQIDISQLTNCNMEYIQNGPAFEGITTTPYIRTEIYENFKALRDASIATGEINNHVIADEAYNIFGGETNNCPLDILSYERRMAYNSIPEEKQYEKFAFNYNLPYWHSDLSTGFSFSVSSSSWYQFFEYYKYKNYKDVSEEIANNSVWTYEYMLEKTAWLKDNAYKYGFVLRYPEGKEHITRMGYNPAHYRYVGKEVAKIIHDQNLCLEEYYAKYLNDSGYTITQDSVEKVLKLNI